MVSHSAIMLPEQFGPAIWGMLAEHLLGELNICLCSMFADFTLLLKFLDIEILFKFNTIYYTVVHNVISSQ